METEKSAVFALPYIHSFDEEGDIFFITFNTSNEEEARTLAKCICGPKLAEKALIILDKNGGIW
jgi:hypothetical protein